MKHLHPDKEIFFAHRYLGRINNGEEIIQLAALISVDNNEKTTTIKYLRSYLNNPLAISIDPINYPLSQRIFINKFMVTSAFNGIPRIFFEGNVSHIWCQFAKNSHLNSPETSPNSPAQFLLEAVSDNGIWYFTPTRQLIRPIKLTFSMDSARKIKHAKRYI
jgi:hypothetical protein